jgi:hypothetical protein
VTLQEQSISPTVDRPASRRRLLYAAGAALLLVAALLVVFKGPADGQSAGPSNPAAVTDESDAGDSRAASPSYSTALPSCCYPPQIASAALPSCCYPPPTTPADPTDPA